MIIKKIKRYIEDFTEFRRIRQSIKTAELSTAHKSIILNYSTQDEKEINSLILKNLSEEMIKWDLSEEYIRWAKSMLTWRLSYISYKSKYN